MTTKKSEKKSRTPNWTSFKDFISEFRDESDRACVILGVAKLDLVMHQIVREYLVPVPGSNDELLDGDSPLGTFSAKINLLFRLGLIDAQFTRALHLVRKIRNSFAHEVKGCSLESGSHSDRIKELIVPLKHLSFFQDFREHFFAEKKGASIDFRVCLAIMVGRLETLFENITPLTSNHALEFVKPAWISVDEAIAKISALEVE